MNIFQFSKCDLRCWSPLPLRLIVGCGFLEHGYAKLAHNPERFVTILHGLGVPAPLLMGWATIVVELLGELAVLLGVFVPLAATRA
jgi:putative oxidoreductase